MKFSAYIGISIAFCALGLTSCSSDDDDAGDIIQIEEPDTYVFLRDGETTVSFSGQTTRIQMSEELVSSFLDNDETEDNLLGMFTHEEGESNFENADLNSSDKNIISKTAASQDYFSANTVLATEIKQDFETWINLQVSDVFPNWDVQATAGNAGFLQEGGVDGAVRYINEEGLEYNQLFGKSLIGALMTDQALNNYLSPAILDQGDNRDNNTNGIVEEGKNYTTMEHKWDEAYGYVYGTSADKTNPNLSIGADDNFLNKYVGRVEGDPDFEGIAETLFNAFKRGRAAIVAGDYEERDAQADIIQREISKIIAIRAVYYLQQGKLGLEQGVVDYATVFHDLSEGYGFIYSLQFTKNPNTNEPYFDHQEVESLLNQLINAENGLWNVSGETLETLSTTIAASFDFTVEQAASTN